jgi:hypothetical protein
MGMRKAYRTLDLTEAVLVKDHLVQNGVEASVMNLGLVRVPADGVASEVWVADDANGEAVKALIRGFLREVLHELVRQTRGTQPRR